MTCPSVEDGTQAIHEPNTADRSGRGPHCCRIGSRLRPAGYGLGLDRPFRALGGWKRHSGSRPAQDAVIGPPEIRPALDF